METSFVELKQKEVVNVKDGKRLGRIIDIAFCCPEGRITGIIVPGGKSFLFSKNELFIDWGSITKIGEDAILVDIAPAPKPIKGGRRGCEPPPQNGNRQCRRNFDDYE